MSLYLHFVKVGTNQPPSFPPPASLCFKQERSDNVDRYIVVRIRDEEFARQLINFCKQHDAECIPAVEVIAPVSYQTIRDAVRTIAGIESKQVAEEVAREIAESIRSLSDIVWQEVRKAFYRVLSKEVAVNA